MIKVSVLLPVYNVQELELRRAIDCILNQTYSDLDFIVLNNGSTDSIVDEVAFSYTDKRLRYYTQPQMDMATTKNRLVGISKGKYVAFADCDYLSQPNRIEEQIKILDENEQIGLCGSWYENKNEAVKYPEQVKPRDFLIKNTMFLPCVMARQKLIWDLKFKDSFLPNEDFELFTRAFAKTELYNIQRVLVKNYSNKLVTSNV